jgi:hypothetical protein
MKVERCAGQGARGEPRDRVAEDEFHGSKSPQKGQGDPPTNMVNFS